MAGIKEIKKRINSVSDTQKITNAMYLIASTKLRKAKLELEATKPYFDALRNEIDRMFIADEDVDSTFFFPPGYKNGDEIEGTYGYLVVTADKGLAGAYNQNVLKCAMAKLDRHQNSKLYVVGEYGRHYFLTHSVDIEQSFLYTAQNPSIVRADEIARVLLDQYVQGELSQIFIIYTDMKNGISEEVRCDRLLPLHRGEFGRKGQDENCDSEFEYDPGVKEVLDTVVPSFLTGYIYSSLVDSFCSEQNARMMAMDSANSNANDLIGALRLQYNHLRQNAITQEITEVAAGAKAKRKKMEHDKQKRMKEDRIL